MGVIAAGLLCVGYLAWPDGDGQEEFGIQGIQDAVYQLGYRAHADGKPKPDRGYVEAWAEQQYGPHYGAFCWNAFNAGWEAAGRQARPSAPRSHEPP